jgi:hypothetical protein
MPGKHYGDIDICIGSAKTKMYIHMLSVFAIIYVCTELNKCNCYIHMTDMKFTARIHHNRMFDFDFLS